MCRARREAESFFHVPGTSEVPGTSREEALLASGLRVSVVYYPYLEASLTEAGPLVQLQISLSRVPWRLAPAWSVLAGAFAAGTPLGEPALWLRVVAAVVLGDLAWGVLRRYVTVSAAGGPSSARLAAVLPYAQPDAPVSYLVRELSPEGTDWHGAFAGLVFALGGALLLGLPALVLSVLAILVTIVAWALARRNDTPAACFALLDVFLPFALGLVAAGWLPGRPVSGSPVWQPLLVAAAFAVLQWGVLRSGAPAGHGGGLAGLGLGVLAVWAVLIGLGMPWAAAMTAVLLAPPLYWLSRNLGAPASASETAPGSGTPARVAASSAWAAPWLMLALFVAALALR